MITQHDQGYAKDFSEIGLWDKIIKALNAGKDLIDLVLQLFYAMQSQKTPTWAKAVIVGALGYFISPIDAIPDLTPIIGYADDLGVLTSASATVAAYIDDDVKEKAAKKLAEWFGK